MKKRVPSRRDTQSHPNSNERRGWVKISAAVPIELGTMQRVVAESYRQLKAAERADERASQALSAARERHGRNLVALRNAFASVEGANK